MPEGRSLRTLVPMIDLLLNETFVRAALNWFAIATPVLALLLYFLGVGRRQRALTTGEHESPASAPSASADKSPTDADQANGTVRSPISLEESLLARAPKGPPSPARVFLLVFGLLGPFVWLLWHVYEGIMDHFGFASVKGLLIVLALFAASGLAAGWLIGRSLRPHRP